MARDQHTKLAMDQRSRFILNNSLPENDKTDQESEAGEEG